MKHFKIILAITTFIFNSQFVRAQLPDFKLPEVIDNVSKAGVLEEVRHNTLGIYSSLGTYDINSSKIYLSSKTAVSGTDSFIKPAVNQMVIVDTTQEVVLKEHNDFGRAITGLSAPRDIEHSYTKAYPVFIYNFSDSTNLVFFSERSLTIILQAVDRDGKWKPLERSVRLMCGTGARFFAVEPGKVLVTKVRKYKGDFRTCLRLRVASVGQIAYSNVFWGNIDELQFGPR